MFLINKKIVFIEKRYLLKFNSIKSYLLLIKHKDKQFKKIKTYLNETMVEKQERQKWMC